MVNNPDLFPLTRTSATAASHTMIVGQDRRTIRFAPRSSGSRTWMALIACGCVMACAFLLWKGDVATSVVFAAFSALFLKAAIQPKNKMETVFDRNSNLCTFSDGKYSETVAMAEIKCIAFIRKKKMGLRGIVEIGELNLVFHDSKRRNISTSGDLSFLRNQATDLGMLITRPVLYDDRGEWHKRTG